MASAEALRDALAGLVEAALDDNAESDIAAGDDAVVNVVSEGSRDIDLASGAAGFVPEMRSGRRFHVIVRSE
jgi:hypothetical protein